ncbi:MAG: hypothetical protein A3I24_01460 [Candidatus Harrisonbacteria bacterium RIFCSPLOWO2_02_FULL_41_13b]|uniref:HTH luxR-type domain-containing protein n=1 Tax=Candidatus Harrisonbacteria bacterium RIFCSPLOWO2_02_FULL_41_13b TaxID=1798409 RepID=A0A1G1ZSV9_9BACT|nr:MAG: hypothetical protein A3J53_02100 [Candidatus Harrisonbacteria bacterium RIFCSPHIGHO2_02_FULL_40_20]OGY67823.1 MAG: hypothetical protein A3I24_01460 [Candidatus Harrisonbacteria bacterium RIFCSPLOWO2_02_FULL_41_13b]
MKKEQRKKIFMGRQAEKWQEQLWKKLLYRLSQTRSKEAVEYILTKLLSNHEKRILLKRLAVMTLIKSRRSYREISEILWLSPNTVSMIKKNFFDSTLQHVSYYASRKKNIRLGSKHSSSDLSFNNSVLVEIIDGFF